MQCNVILRKLLSAHKSHVRETSLFTGANMRLIVEKILFAARILNSLTQSNYRTMGSCLVTSQRHQSFCIKQLFKIFAICLAKKYFADS